MAIVVAEDDSALRGALSDALESAGHEVLLAADGVEALQLVRDHAVGLVLTDVQMPRMDGYALLGAVKQEWPQIPVVMMTAYGDVGRAVQAVRDGASHYITKPFEVEDLLAEVARFRAPVGTWGSALHSPALKELFGLAQRVAATDSTVLLTGESGVGKEVMARFIHQHSRRINGPFVALNCAAIPDNLLESTLFGHEKGAFTGAATAHAGKFEQADGGTLLLDEVTELPLELQAKLLRALQEREVERVGGRKPLPVDIRVIATSNRDMARFVEEGRFREDLYYRLNVFPIAIPPLRARPGDIEALALHFLHQFDSRYILKPAALDALRAHAWPGNVRELANVVERATIVAAGLDIGPEHLMLPGGRRAGGFEVAEAAVAGASQPDLLGDSDTDLRTLERRHILEVLAQCKGCRRATAERLGMPERTLRYKLARWRAEGLIETDV